LRDKISAWTEHIPFGMYLVSVVQPKLLVELGVHIGVSYSAFCQACKELNLDTHCYGVDTWQGDAHIGVYGDEILQDLKAHHDALYGSSSTLIRNTFAGAIDYFESGSIDLLHIDGLHTYEAVKQDFEQWLPKISKRGIVLFHDTTETKRDFGVWKLWREVSEQYPHFEMQHGHGLGMLLVGPDCPEELRWLCTASLPEQNNIRAFFYQLGHRLLSQQELVDLKVAYAAKTKLYQDQWNSMQELMPALDRLHNMEQRRGFRLLRTWYTSGWRGLLGVAKRKLQPSDQPAA
jgi:hypothetical protein